MATPHVAGAVALCASLDSSLSAAAVRSRRARDGRARPPSLFAPTVSRGRARYRALWFRGADVSVPDLRGPDDSVACRPRRALPTSSTPRDRLAGSRETHSEAPHGTIGAGRIISSTPAAGTLVSAGSAVDYVVSTGPPRVGIPDLVDLPEAAALLRARRRRPASRGPPREPPTTPSGPAGSSAPRRPPAPWWRRAAPSTTS